MKNTVLITVLLIFFITYQGFAQQQSSQPPADRIPVKSEFIDALLRIQGNSDNVNLIKYYLSKPFTLIIDQQQKIVVIGINGDGTVNINPPSPAEPINFSADSAGKLVEIDRTKGLLIYFEDYKIYLRFRKNAQDSFELYSVVYLESYNIRFNVEPPQLNISGKDYRNIITETEGHVSLSASSIDQQQYSGGNDDRQIFQRNTVSFNGGNLQSGDSRTYLIESNGYATQRGIIEYLRSKKGYLIDSDIALIEKYLDEAGREGVNHDIAIAQMLFWTDFMRNRERMAAGNYGGLSRTGGWNGIFPYQMSDGMTEGVRAHIQHLKLYSNAKLNQQNVDPRYNVLRDNNYIGRFSTAQEIFRVWSQSGSYGSSVLEIIDNLRRYTDMQR